MASAKPPGITVLSQEIVEIKLIDGNEIRGKLVWFTDSYISLEAGTPQSPETVLIPITSIVTLRKSR